LNVAAAANAPSKFAQATPAVSAPEQIVGLINQQEAEAGALAEPEKSNRGEPQAPKAMGEPVAPNPPPPIRVSTPSADAQVQAKENTEIAAAKPIAPPPKEPKAILRRIEAVQRKSDGQPVIAAQNSKKADDWETPSDRRRMAQNASLQIAESPSPAAAAQKEPVASKPKTEEPNPQPKPEASSPSVPAPPAAPATTSVEKPAPGPLSLRNVALCSEVHGFGDVVRAGESVESGRTVLVYCELDNYRAEKVGNQMETRLTPSIELAPADGGPSTTVRFDPVVDRWPTRRREFFCYFEFPIPAATAPGAYTVRVRVQDSPDAKPAEAAATLRVQPPKQGG
jgi:hypothetical protein